MGNCIIKRSTQLATTSSSPRVVVANVIEDNGNKKKQNVSPLVLGLITLMDLPTQVRIKILNYLGETQEELRTLAVISKAINEDCKRLGIVWEFIPEFVLSPSKEEQVGRINFLQNLLQYQQDEDTYNKLQTYRIFRVNAVDKLDILSNNVYGFFQWITANNIRMEGIRTLNISLPPSSTTTKEVPMNDLLPRALSFVMPNLVELDFSNTGMGGGPLSSCFSGNCPHLEKITWNNFSRISEIYLTGLNMGNITNLNEISMDNSTFCCSEEIQEKLSNLINHPETFIFHKCCLFLERVSIRNATFFDFHYDHHTCKYISQDALIKFVRNAPATLIWFRSDLTQENMNMLHNERPDIELVN